MSGLRVVSTMCSGNLSCFPRSAFICQSDAVPRSPAAPLGLGLGFSPARLWCVVVVTLVCIVFFTLVCVVFTLVCVVVVTLVCVVVITLVCAVVITLVCVVVVTLVCVVFTLVYVVVVTLVGSCHYSGVYCRYSGV